MEDTVTYGQLIFDRSFVSAGQDRDKIQFTRQERALLLCFTRNPRKLLTRSQLLDALAGTGNRETSERNIDYLVNRLRAKLGDDVRKPVYITTHYGEGYMWVAERHKTVPDDTFMIIGPVFGIDGIRDPSAPLTFMKLLASACNRNASSDQSVVLAPEWRPRHSGGAKARFHVEIGFHERHDMVHVALVLRSRQPQRILHTARAILSSDNSFAAANDLAETLRTQMWMYLAEPAHAAAALTDAPLELRVHAAGQLLGRSDQSWMESGEQIARSRKANPADPKLDLMWASHLSTRLTLSGIRLAPHEREAIEDEIEDLALSALPRIREDPILSLSAAQLLLGVERGHFDLAEELAERAFSESVAFAATFSLLGQLRMFRGDIDEALHLYDRGIELSEKDTEFHVFLVVLKCSALAASGRRKELKETLAALYAVDPTRKMKLGLIFPPALPSALEPELAALLDGLGPEHAGALLTYIHHISARHFREETHRANLLRGPVSHVAGRFGKTAVPAEIWNTAPSLLPPDTTGSIAAK